MCVVHDVVLVKMIDRVVTTSNLCTCLLLASGTGRAIGLRAIGLRAMHAESGTGRAIGLRAMHAARNQIWFAFVSFWMQELIMLKPL